MSHRRINRHMKDVENSKKVKRENSVLFTLLFIIFFILFIISFIKIILYISNTITNKKLIKEINKSVTIEQVEDESIKYNIDFDVLRLINSDIVGYVDVSGTDIGYTVVKTDNNDYYLNHNYEKNYSDLGWIFADYRNKFDEKDKNIIIYGHNMKNGTMFASLKTILTDEWFNNKDNRFVTFVKEDKEINYEVFSVYQIGNEEKYIQTDFKENEFKSWADEMKSRSKYDFGIEIGEDDKVITLSTCGNTSSTRVVLHAKEIIKEK